MKNNQQQPKKSIANAVESTLGGFSPQVNQQLIGAQQTQVYQGPIPPPEVLKGFDELVPGTAQRLIQLAEDESEHRRKLEVDAMSANIEAQQRSLSIGEYQSKAVFRSDTIGQFFGFIVSISCIAGAVYLAVTEHQGAAAALSAIPTAAVIRAFFVKKDTQNP